MGITTSTSLRVLTKGYINRKPLKAKKRKKKKKKR
tara:strand:- start:2348 stop:2452 length:105 start_codon:yes stop_codon:yes gene_type:complete